MKLDVSQALKDQGQSYGFEGKTELPSVSVMGDDISFENVRLKGEYVAARDSVSIDCVIEAIVKTRCSLCTIPIEYPIKTRLKATYLRQIPADDPDAYPLEGYEADVDRAASDALLLELPMRAVCRDDCRGLCPVCGVNRNMVTCACQEGGERPNPFSALTKML